MIGDLRISFKPTPAITSKHNSCIQLTASVNGSRFRMALKHVTPTGLQKEKILASISSTLFRIYKEAQLQGKRITAQALKTRFLSEPATLLYEVLQCVNHENLINVQKTITYDQYRFQLKTTKQIAVFCQLTYGLPDISISALPNNFLNQLNDFFSQQQDIEKSDREDKIRFIRSTLLKEHKKGVIELSASTKKHLINFHVPEKKLMPKDINKLAETHLPQHLEIIRDAFIFSCHTGLTYDVIKQLTGRSLRIVSDKSLWLFTNKQQYLLSALPEDLQYKIKSKDPDEQLFKLPTIQYVNLSLRTIIIKSGIEIDLTFKSAYKFYIFHYPPLK